MLAVDAGIDRTYVSRLERGLENPSVAVLEKLARALSSNIEEFFTAVGGVEFGAGDGFYRLYQNGAIYWKPQLGAFWVHGAIYFKYKELGGEAGFLGYPVTDETAAPDSIGRFNHFERGSIYWSPTTGAHEIHGAIRDKWASLGWEAFVSGYPTSDETDTPDGVGRCSRFERGVIYWTPDNGAWEVHGAILDKWLALGGIASYLGYPTSDEGPWNDTAGRVSRFQRGKIAWTSPRGPFDLPDTIVLSSPLIPPEPITGWVELVINSAGFYAYRGHVHDSGAVGYHVAVASVLNFKDKNGNVFAAAEEGGVEGTTSIGSRNHDWDWAGFAPLVRDNFDALRSVGMTTTIKVDVTAGDVVQAILFAIPIAIGVAAVSTVVYLFASGQIKACDPVITVTRNPHTHEPGVEVSIPIVWRDPHNPTRDPCKGPNR